MRKSRENRFVFKKYLIDCYELVIKDENWCKRLEATDMRDTNLQMVFTKIQNNYEFEKKIRAIAYGSKFNGIKILFSLLADGSYSQRGNINCFVIDVLTNEQLK